MSLTVRQQQFCAEYLIDLNASQAAIRAGYAKSRASATGARLVANGKVAAEIQRRMQAREETTGITAERVLTELARVAFVDISGIVTVSGGKVTVRDTDELTEDQRRAISEVSQTVTQFGGTTRIKFNDKLKALELIGKHLGMFVERIEHTNNEKKVVIYLPDNNRDGPPAENLPEKTAVE